MPLSFEVAVPVTQGLQYQCRFNPDQQQDHGHPPCQARTQAEIPEGAQSFAMKSTRQGSNDGELLYPSTYSEFTNNVPLTPPAICP